MPQALHLARY